MHTPIGKKRFRVRIDAPTAPPDPNTLGEGVPAWRTLATVWGSLETLSGRELAYGRQFISEVSHRLCIRYRDDVDTTCKLVVGGREFRIASVIDAENLRRETQIYAYEY